MCVCVRGMCKKCSRSFGIFFQGQVRDRSVTGQ